MLKTNCRTSSVATIIGALILALFLAAGCEDPGSYGDGETAVYGRLVVHPTSVEPPMDDLLNEIWDDAVTGGIFVNDSAFIAVADTIDSLPVSLKAIKTDEYIYIRAEWGEAAFVGNRTYSIWEDAIAHLLTVDTTYDTNGVVIDTVLDTLIDAWGSRPYDVVGSDTIWYSQDRFAMIWDMGNNGAEGADCRSMCHVLADTSINGDRMYTTGGGNVDVWHWQAGTTDPVLLAQDEYWGPDGRAIDAFGQEIFTSNFDIGLLQPKFMHRDTTAYSGKILRATDTRPFDSTMKWNNGVILPGYVLHENASGSIADVASFSGFSATTRRWLVLMRRALTTGNADDGDLSSIASGDSVMVSIAFMNHTDSTHYGSRPFYIIFP